MPSRIIQLSGCYTPIYALFRLCLPSSNQLSAAELCCLLVHRYGPT